MKHSNKRMYNSIINEVAKIVKTRINENYNDEIQDISIRIHCPYCGVLNTEGKMTEDGYTFAYCFACEREFEVDERFIE